MAQAHTHEGAPAAEPVLPHGSRWPIVAALGIALLYFGVLGLGRGMAFGVPLFGLAALLILFSVAQFVREDQRWWRENVSTGLRNGWWGVVFFLGTEVMLFSALFATFFNHRAAAVGVPELERLWGEGQALVGSEVFKTGINTVILLLSGVTMHWAHLGIRMGKVRQLQWGLVLTIVLGAVFIGGQVVEYLELAHEGLVIQQGTFGSTFYVLTGTHGAHVLGGLAVLCLVAIRAFRGQFDQQKHVAVEVTAIYWHFVDVVWVLLFAIVYLGFI